MLTASLRGEVMPNSDWPERRIVSSAALIANDGAVALGLTLDDGLQVAGLVDLRVIDAIRRQLDRCQAALQSPTQPAQ